MVLAASEAWAEEAIGNTTRHTAVARHIGIGLLRTGSVVAHAAILLLNARPMPNGGTGRADALPAIPDWAAARRTGPGVRAWATAPAGRARRTAAAVSAAAELTASATATSRVVVEAIATRSEEGVGDSMGRARAATVLADPPASDPEAAVAEVSEEVAEGGDGRRRREDRGVSI